MKKTVLYVLLVLLLCGCKAEKSITATMPETKVPESLEMETDEDVELKQLEAKMKNEDILTLSVQGKMDPNTQMCGVREIQVYRGEQLLQSVQMEEAIQRDGVDGIAEGYTECISIEDAAELKDVNFDGNPDLEICGWCPNNAIPYYYWCWNPETERFEYAFSMQLREVDAENQQLVAWYKVENGLYYTDRYWINDSNQPELADREIEDVRPE